MVDDPVLHELLAACDLAAVENVRAGRGGPFAASVHVYDQSSSRMQEIVAPVGNAVLETGLASAHAEDRAIVPENVAKLQAALRQVGPDNAHVYLISSGESCPACHAKIEILARKLVHENVLLPGRFTVIYGASYEDTRDVAGFNDAPYQEDFQKPAGTGLVKQTIVKLLDLPAELRTKMMDIAAPIALIAAKDKILAGGGEYPEVSAIRFASAMQKRVKMDDPWNLRAATLYTFTRDIGPMTYAECQWANVAHWVSVAHPDAALFATQEAPGITNHALFGIVARRPYTHPDSALILRQLLPFANLGQKEWAARPELRRYNGV